MSNTPLAERFTLNTVPDPANMAQTGEVVDNLESFMPFRGARRLVDLAVADRIDPNTGRILPIDEERVFVGTNGSMEPLDTLSRDDVVLPVRTSVPVEGGKVVKSYDFGVEGALENGLTHIHSMRLSGDEVTRLRAAQTDLERSLDERGYDWRIENGRQQDAYHIRSTSPPESDDRIMSPLRVFVPGDVDGVAIAARAIEHGATFNFAKVWVAQAAEGPQTFRRDCPVFQVSTLEQLNSVVAALRQCATEGSLPAMEDFGIGLPIDGVPGAYVVQPDGGDYFHGKMARFWAGPIQEAHDSTPLPEGGAVTNEWLDDVAHRARELAYEQAVTSRISPAHHALLVGQNPEAILGAVKSRQGE